MYNLPLQLAL